MTSSNYIQEITSVVNKWNNRLSWDELFMINALTLSARSSCDRLHVGCVLVKDNRIISSGYNGFLSGAPHKSFVRDGHEQATVHAEQNAIANAARNNACIKDCIAYITHYPCINCAKILASSGIKTIKYLNDYKNDELISEILKSVNIQIIKL